MTGVNRNRRSPQNALEPDPTRIVELSARHHIEPYRQGNLDGLCGVYTAINGLRLALHPHGPLTKADAKRLNGRGCQLSRS